MKIKLIISMLLLLLAVANADKGAHEKLSAEKVVAVSNELRKQFGLSDFYQKALVLEGFPILSSAQVHDMGLKTVDPTFDNRLRNIYEKAKKKGLWKGKYAIQSHHEYWAEATQSWFWNNRENDPEHNHVNTREELVVYDPDVANLCKEVYGENRWRYLRSDDGKRRLSEHLKNLDRKKLPTFSWSKKEQEAYDAHLRKQRR